MSAKLAIEGSAPPRTRWIAIPRDLERLASKTRNRLNREYITAGSAFEDDQARVRERLQDLSDAA